LGRLSRGLLIEDSCGIAICSQRPEIGFPNGGFDMVELTVPAFKRRKVLDEHAAWLRQIPRQPGQVGGAIGAIVESGPFPAPRGLVTSYSDFDDGNFVRFTVDQSFLDYLEERGVSF
jgi:hypothetical protein